MRLIGFYGHDLITKLPVYPNTETYGNFIFDPSSYGQYLDGTPNGHSPGFIDKEQIALACNIAVTKDALQPYLPVETRHGTSLQKLI